MRHEKTRKIEEERKRDTEASRRAEKSSINGVVVRKNVSAIDATSLNWMVCFCVKHRIYAASTSAHLHSLSTKLIPNFL